MTIHGWDSSHYDWERGSMDLAAAKRDGIVFATHKVSEGGSYADPQFAAFASRARAAGMPLIGGYCVNRRGDQRPQVDWFIKQLDAKSPWWRDGDFLVQLDCERWSRDGVVYAYEPRLYEIQAWCDYFVARTNGRWVPIVYAPRWVYGDTLRGLPYPLWASDFGKNPTVAYRAAYPGDTSSRWVAYSGQTPAILQYGSRTTIGSQTICDANAYRGTLPELVALTQGDDVTPQDLDQIKSKVLYTNLEQSNASGPSLGTLVFRIFDSTATAAAKVADLSAKVDALTGVAGQPITDEQLERVLRKVLGSVDN